LTDDGKTPTRRLFIGLGDGGPDHTHSSLVGVKRIDLVRIPELNVLFAVGIV
jgi:hypothetical protein